MPFIPAPGVCQIELLWTYQNQECENVLYFDRAEGWDGDTLLAFAGAIYGNAETILLTGAPNSLVLRGVKATDLSSDSAPSVEYTITPAPSGTSLSPAAPNNVSLAISFRTAARGRTSRGRNYIVGIQEEEVANNIVAQSAIDRWMEFYDVMIGSGIGAVAQWVVLSRYNNNVPRTEALARPVTTYGPTDVFVDSMRRRLPGRGT